MKGKSLLLAGAAVMVLGSLTNAAYAGSSSPQPVDQPSNAELAARIAALEAELQAEEDHRSADHTRLSTLEQNFNDTSWTFDNLRPTVKSGDGRFTMAFRVRFQADYANFFQDAPNTINNAATRDLSNGAVIRRAYFGVEGKAFNDFWYEFRLNGGGSNGGLSAAGSSAGAATGGEGDPLVNIARVAYLGIPNLRINVGVIEPVFMFEGTVSSAGLMQMERPEIDNIAADSFGAGDSRRGIELVFQKQGIFKGDDNLVVSAAYTGNKTGSSVGHGNGGDEQSQVLGRISYRAWSDGISNLVFGASGADAISTGGTGTATGAASIGSLNFQDRPEIRVDGTRLVSTGGIPAKSGYMYAFDAGMNWENFFLGGEYADFTMDRYTKFTPAILPGADHPSFSGWYIEGSWVLTGETKGYTVNATNNEAGGFTAPVPGRPFSLAGDSWGAWELTARYSNTNLNSYSYLSTAQGGIFGGEEKIFTIGLNWYLNRAVKVQLQDEIVSVDRFSNLPSALAPGVNPQIGQDMNILGIRVQFTN
jgi:phosphate-selective porin OprO/OprP